MIFNPILPGGQVHVPLGQRHPVAGRRPPGQPGLRHGPPQLCDEQLIHQPDSGPDQPLDRGPQVGRVHAAQEARRGGGAPASRPPRRQADRADAHPGQLHQRARRGTLQAGSLQILGCRVVK